MYLLDKQTLAYGKCLVRIAKLGSTNSTFVGKFKFYGTIKRGNRSYDQFSLG